MAQNNEHLQRLQALLPTGPIWPREPGATLTKFLQAWADELARVDGRAGDLANELDPATTFELLPDYERVCGLPGGCAYVAGGLAERRAAVKSQISARGGQSPGYFIELAAAAGYQVSITEFRPFTADGTCDLAVCGDDWAHAWQVGAPETTVREMTADGTCAEALASWGNERLECLLSAKAPSHTVPIFSYSE